MQGWALRRAHVPLVRCCGVWWDSSMWLNKALNSGKTGFVHMGQHVDRLPTSFCEASSSTSAQEL